MVRNVLKAILAAQRFKGGQRCKGATCQMSPGQLQLPGECRLLLLDSPLTKEKGGASLGTQLDPCLLRVLAVPQESLALCSAATPSCCGSSEKGLEKRKPCWREEQHVIAYVAAVAGAELGFAPFSMASSATRILSRRRHQWGCSLPAENTIKKKKERKFPLSGYFLLWGRN